jgi:hypothetical protein
MLTAYRDHVADNGEKMHDLHQMVRKNPIDRRDLRDRDEPAGMQRQIHQGPQCVVGKGRQPHRYRPRSDGQEYPP